MFVKFWRLGKINKVMSKICRFIDIGANLIDDMYLGIYNGSKKHEPDLKAVLQRGWNVGIEKIIISGGDLEKSKKSLELSKSDDRLYTTVGCHPTRCMEFEKDGQDPDDYIQKLKDVIFSGKDKIVAVGECGLDYDRCQFCPKDIQQKYFEYQLKMNEEFQLPLFLHCRNAAEDLYRILSKYRGFKGVIHSFDGSAEEADRFIKLGYYIGLNGCSLKTQDNLDTIKTLPTSKLLLETDCPWCEIRPTHAGYPLIKKENQVIPYVKKEKWKPDCMVKSRNEPCNIRQILDVISYIKEEEPIELSEKIYQNTLDLFFSQANRTI